VTNICGDAIEGKYPFVKSSYEVSMEDFANIFSSGGVLDTFFTTRLQQSVDTNSRPWKYKTVEQINTQQMIAAASSSAAANPNANTSLVNHPTLETELAKLLIKNGPNPEIFAQAQDIRSAFFQEPGGKKVALKLNYRIVEVDPSITELIMNFDGQVHRYIHGPIQTITFKWPGSISGAEAEMTANPQIRRDTSIIRTEGPWALFKLLERGKLIKTASGSRTAAEFKIDDRRVLLDFSSEASVSPFNLDQLRKFSCPRVR
jgi:type VI secretion system protein ImpL